MTDQTELRPVVLVGEVRAVTLHDDDASGGACRLRLDDGATITAHFSAEHLPGIAMALLYHADRRLKIAGLGDFAPDGRLKRLLRIETQQAAAPSPRLPTPSPAPQNDLKPFWQSWVELGASFPDEEWAKFPPDFAANMAHYMYGLPKPDDAEPGDAEPGDAKPGDAE